MKKVSRYLMITLVGVLLVACGSDDAEKKNADSWDINGEEVEPHMKGMGAPTSRSELQAFYTAFDQASCERRKRCINMNADVEQCILDAKTGLAPVRQRQEKAAAAGRMSFSKTSAEACLTLHAGMCGVLAEANVLATCNGVLTGIQKQGEYCETTLECANDPQGGLLGISACTHNCMPITGRENPPVTGTCQPQSLLGMNEMCMEQGM